MAELVFGKYEIQHRLAIGGMGEVFYAVQKGVPGFERPVILKSLLPDLASQEGFIDQFLDEARVAATLNHPNVVSIYEVGLWNGTYFIAMEYIRGRNLAQLGRRAREQQTPVPPIVAAHIIRDAALGLQHAHTATDSNGNALSVVHRDVSPQNIMVRDDGVTKVVDFGIARATNRATRTATGALKGKLAYMAPEQLTAQGITALTDQFALGIVFWELLTGRRLFKSENDVDVVKKVVEEEIPLPSSVAPHVPAQFDDVAMHMLQRNPAKRFADCAHVAAALQQASAGMTPSGDSPVAAYMRRLGTEDLAIRVKATPSEKNFVISLKPPGSTEDIEINVATGTPLALPKKKPASRAPVAAVLLGAVVLGAGTAWLVTQKLRTPAHEVVVAQPLGDAADGAVEPERDEVTSDALGRRIATLEEKLRAATPKDAKPDPAALKTLGECRRDPATTPAARDALAKRLDEWERTYLQAPAPAQAMLKVTTQPPGGVVRVDGRPLGAAPQELELAAAMVHYVAVEKPGFRRSEQEVTLAAAEKRELVVKLVALQGDAPPPLLPPANHDPGFLSLETTPWSKVSIDGEPAGSTPLFKKRLSAGRHALVLVNEGEDIRTTRNVDIQPGQTTKLKLSLK